MRQHITNYLLLGLLAIMPLFLSAQDAKFEENAIFIKLKKGTDISVLLKRGRCGDLIFNEALQPYSVAGLQYVFHAKHENLRDIYQLSFYDAKDREPLLKTLSAQDYIEYAEKIPVYSVDYMPNDYDANAQYYIDKINAPAAWDLTKGDTNVVIAVIDNAVWITHPDLSANIFHNWAELQGINGSDDDGNGFVDDINGWDAANIDNDPNPAVISNFDHGTHVAGCAAAVADNGIGVAGVGFHTKILPVKAKSDGTTGSTLNATLQGFNYAISCGFTDVINMSFGGANSYSITWQLAINTAHDLGIVVIAAAGNSSADVSNYYPASYVHVISVASTNDNDQKSWFSNYGAVDVSSPGSSIKSTTIANLNPPIAGYQSWDGTSMAAPVAAGVVALMIAANPALSPDAVESCLKQTCDNIDALNPIYAGQLGAGRINAGNAVACVIPTVRPTANFAHSNVTSCNGHIDFTDLSQNLPMNWSWNFGNGQTATNSNPSIDYGTSGNYTVTLIVSNPIGSDTFTQVLNVNSLVVPQVNVSEDTSICFGQSLVLQASTNMPGSILWSPGVNLNDSTILSPTCAVQVSQTYILNVTIANGCVGQDSIRITKKTNPTLNAGANQTIAQGTSITLSPICVSTLAFSWSPPTGLSNTTIKNPIASPTSTTLYTLTVTNSLGCSKSDDVLVTVTEPTAIEDISGNQIYPLFPNPTYNELHIKANFVSNEQVKLVVYDMLGQKVATPFEGKVAAGDFEWVWKHHLAAGFYTLVWEMQEAKKQVFVVAE